jgi:hypothetical protein
VLRRIAPTRLNRGATALHRRPIASSAPTTARSDRPQSTDAGVAFLRIPTAYMRQGPRTARPRAARRRHRGADLRIYRAQRHQRCAREATDRAPIAHRARCQVQRTRHPPALASMLRSQRLGTASVPADAQSAPAPDDERACPPSVSRRPLGTSSRSATQLDGVNEVHRHDVGGLEIAQDGARRPLISQKRETERRRKRPQTAQIRRFRHVRRPCRQHHFPKPQPGRRALRGIQLARGRAG